MKDASQILCDASDPNPAETIRRYVQRGWLRYYDLQGEPWDEAAHPGQRGKISDKRLDRVEVRLQAPGIRRYLSTVRLSRKQHKALRIYDPEED